MTSFADLVHARWRVAGRARRPRRARALRGDARALRAHARPDRRRPLVEPRGSRCRDLLPAPVLSGACNGRCTAAWAAWPPQRPEFSPLLRTRRRRGRPRQQRPVGQGPAPRRRDLFTRSRHVMAALERHDRLRAARAPTAPCRRTSTRTRRRTASFGDLVHARWRVEGRRRRARARALRGDPRALRGRARQDRRRLLVQARAGRGRAVLQARALGAPASGRCTAAWGASRPGARSTRRLLLRHRAPVRARQQHPVRHDASASRLEPLRPEPGHHGLARTTATTAPHRARGLQARPATTSRTTPARRAARQAQVVYLKGLLGACVALARPRAGAGLRAHRASRVPGRRPDAVRRAAWSPGRWARS